MLDISLNPDYKNPGAPTKETNSGLKAPVKTKSVGKAITTTTLKGGGAKVATTTILCAKGKDIKKVTGAKPVCPVGYKKQ